MPTRNSKTSADASNFTNSQSGIGNVLNIGTESDLRTRTTKANIDAASNLGSQNPFKKYNPKSLFYDGAKLDSNIATGSFLFYAFDGSRGTNQIIQDVYNNSESPAINQKISSTESKNPSASFLVRQTIELVNRNLAGSSTGRGITNNILGGKSAPYYWKDFLYCKHYGKIPNNYMLTLRRY